MKTINENGTFRKRSPEWNFLKTPFWRVRVDRRKRNFSKTLRSHYQSQYTPRNIRNLFKKADGRSPFLSFILGLGHAQSGKLSFSNSFIVYVWTGENDAKTLRVDANFLKTEKKSCVFKGIRIRVDRALVSIESKIFPSEAGVKA